LPRGFNENEIKEFFSQFGQVTKLRVARSKRTARTKGYCFLEFAEAKVAVIAQKAMHNYMMFGRQLDVQIVERPNYDTFKHGNRDWKFVPTQLMFRNKKNAESKTPEHMKARVEGLLQKEKEKRDRLKELMIDYSFPGYKALVMTSKSSKKSSKVDEESAAPKKSAKKEEPKKEVERKQAKTEVKAVEEKPVKAEKKSKKQEAPVIVAEPTKQKKQTEVAAVEPRQTRAEEKAAVRKAAKKAEVPVVVKAKKEEKSKDKKKSSPIAEPEVR
jgi:nucleolar protein 15